jgi:YVTN family beta-propeller protein
MLARNMRRRGWLDANDVADRGQWLRSRRWRWAIFPASLAVLALGALASSADAYHAYVVNTDSASVSVIDTEANRTVGPPIPVGQYALGVAAGPDGRKVYVAGPTSGIWVIDTQTDEVARPPIPVEGLPRYISITPDGGTAYMTKAFSSDVVSLDLQLASELEPPISVESEPSKVAISPDGKTAYVLRGTAGKNGVTVVDIWNRRVVASIPFDVNVGDIAIAPDGKTVYVLGSEPDRSFSGVWRIDAESNEVMGAPVFVPDPGRIAVAPGGGALYVTGFPGVWVIDARSNELVGPPIPVAGALGIAVTPDGHLAYVTQTASNSVTAVDIRAREAIGSPIPVGSGPFEIAIPEDLPSVRIGCPEGDSNGCRLTLQAVTKRTRGRAQSTVTNVKLRSKLPRLVPLRPRHRFSRRLARVRRVLVRETFIAHGKRRIAYRRLRLFHR